jgi:hypothetical protein
MKMGWATDPRKIYAYSTFVLEQEALWSARK